jgi:hypothetical protein
VPYLRAAADLEAAIPISTTVRLGDGALWPLDAIRLSVRVRGAPGAMRAPGATAGS